MGKKVALITPPSHSHRTSEENLGVGYLAAVLRKEGNFVTIIDGWLLDLGIQEIVDQVKSLKSVDLIGISCYISSISDVSELIREIRGAGLVVPIVAGGYGPTFHPEDFLSVGCTYVLRGEAEQSILELLNAITDPSFPITEVEGLVYKSGTGEPLSNRKATPKQNLDTLPFPSRDSVQATINLKNPIHISTSRGCTANCLFCSVVSFDRQMKQTTLWRSRTIPNFVEEIYRLYNEFGTDCFKIVDDSFIEPPRNVEWVQELATELQKRNLTIKFRTQVRADRLNPDLVAALANVGWFATSIGVESGSVTALKRMNKSAVPSDNINALTILQSHSIYVQMGMILFDPYTTLLELQENLAFLKSLDWVVTKGIFTEMYASEGTPFSKKLASQGLVIDSRHGNYQYRIESNRVELVYRALKAWHKSHASTYDHAINPISAPKTLPMLGYAEYHEICLQLYKLDLEFFGEVLYFVDCSDQVIDDFVADRILVSVPIYNRILQSVLDLDAKYGLSYSTEPNPFL